MKVVSLALFLSSALSLLPTIGCTPGKVTREWSEEVALDDGRIITIDRYVAFRESNSWAGDAYNATEIRSTISFRGELSKLPDWDVPLIPILLYKDASSDDWVVIATTSSCEIWSARGRPEPPYWEYRANPGGWRPASLSTGAFGRKSNLFFTYEDKLPEKKITDAEKIRIREDTRIAIGYRMILEIEKSNCS